mmetsp:Transcript_15066/g.13218  ORF Transcript_15066/g.13218 Transcript_15066/m.13218 type:complete len:90 (+) Transcript_15066:212-481(+)
MKNKLKASKTKRCSKNYNKQESAINRYNKKEDKKTDYLTQTRLQREKKDSQNNKPMDYMSRIKKIMGGNQQMIQCLEEETLRQEEKAKF